MIVYFNKKGVLKEQIDDYGNVARVGTETFQILTYFENLDLDNTVAHIRLQKPDFEGTRYPALFMKRVDLRYDPSKTETVSQYFTADGGPEEDGKYPCYLFDFGSITDDNNQPVNLLDQPGLWKAIITIVNAYTNATNVVGTITFNVDGASDSDEEVELDVTEVESNFANVLNDKLDKISGRYVRVWENFEEDATNGTLLTTFFTAGAIVLDSANNTYYMVSTATPVEDDEEHCYATWTIYDPVVYNQAMVSIIRDSRTNINGRTLTAYESTLVTLGTAPNQYQAYKITKSGVNLTEEQAAQYMEYMCGSHFVPKFDYEKPKNALFITATGEVLKPQYDNTNGLLLYKTVNLALQNYLAENYVPFTGASKHVDLGNREITSKKVNIGIAGYITTDGTNFIIEGNAGANIEVTPWQGKKFTYNGYEVATQDYVQYYVSQNCVALTGNQTIAGVKTFTSSPVVPEIPTNDTDAASKSYVDLKIGALGDVFNYRGSFSVSYINTNLIASVLVKGDVVNVTDAGTLTLGNVVVTAGDNVVWNGSSWDRLTGDYVPSSRTVAGIALTNDITAQALTDALVLASNSDVDNLFQEEQLWQMKK